LRGTAKRKIHRKITQDAAWDAGCGREDDPPRMRVHLLLGLAVSVCASTAAEEGPKAEAIPSFGLGKLDFGQRRSADAEEDLPIAREPDKTAVEAPPEPEATHMDTTGDPLAIAPRTPAFWDIIAPVAEKAFGEPCSLDRPSTRRFYWRAQWKNTGHVGRCTSRATRKTLSSRSKRPRNGLSPRFHYLRKWATCSRSHALM
jgi:hypothetical protein